jgi:Arc/MetJ family transcription regulator
MTKRLVDIDDEKLERVRALLGTSTLKATVDGALDEVLALDARRQSLLVHGALEPLDPMVDPEERRAAWG